MSIRGFLTAGITGLLLFLSSGTARADVLLTPFVGANVSGSAVSPLADFSFDYHPLAFVPVR